MHYTLTVVKVKEKSVCRLDGYHRASLVMSSSAKYILHGLVSQIEEGLLGDIAKYKFYIGHYVVQPRGNFWDCAPILILATYKEYTGSDLFGYQPGSDFDPWMRGLLIDAYSELFDQLYNARRLVKATGGKSYLAFLQKPLLEEQQELFDQYQEDLLWQPPSQQQLEQQWAAHLQEHPELLEAIQQVQQPATQQKLPKRRFVKPSLKNRKPPPAAPPSVQQPTQQKPAQQQQLLIKRKPPLSVCWTAASLGWVEMVFCMRVT